MPPRGIVAPPSRPWPGDRKGMQRMNFVAGNDGRGRGIEIAPEVPEVRAPARLRPLLALLPHILRYRLTVAAAFAALLVAAVATLAVPLAVRRMIDFGFSAERVGLIDRYFTVMIAVVAVLAAASALRYYLVTILGERVVADLRARVFEHLTALSAAFFDTAKTGEMISRL